MHDGLTMLCFGRTDRRRRSAARNLLIGLLVSCASTAAQTDTTGNAGRPAPGPESAPSAYWLRVTADQLNVRSRPDTNSIVVAQVPRDAVLQSVGQEFGWHQVMLPDGCFSYVSSTYIERHDDAEGIVKVQQGRLRVRVGSLLRDLNPADAEVQAFLESGARVRILDQQGEWLKIVPPPGVYGYVSGQHALPISDDLAAHLKGLAGTASRPAVESADQPVASRPTRVRPGDAPSLTGAWGRRLATIEEAITAEAQRPAMDQQWSALIARLRPVADQREEPSVARLAQAWVTRLETRAADQAAVRAAEDVLRRMERERAQHERELERIERVREQATTGPAYAACGLLLRSFAVSRTDGTPWYKLQDPLTGRAAVYLEFDPGSEPDPAAHVGEYVGVRGPRRPDDALGADVVRVEAVEVLRRKPPASQPSRRGP